MTRKILVPNLDDLLRRYVAGESENALAKESGINRFTFRTRLVEAGIIPRSQSEAELIKWSRMSARKRATQVAAAHEAARGRKVSFAEKCRRAKAIEGSKTHSVSDNEIVLGNWLRGMGYAPIHNLAVGPYNCDLGISAVAVEVWGGGWHPKPNEADRFKYILDAGHHIMIVDLEQRRFPLSRKVLQHIIALIEFAGSNPTITREYRMVRGNGEFVFRRLNDNNISLIPPFTSRRNPANGQYQRVPR